MLRKSDNEKYVQAYRGLRGPAWRLGDGGEGGHDRNEHGGVRWEQNSPFPPGGLQGLTGVGLLNERVTKQRNDRELSHKLSRTVRPTSRK